MTATSTDSSDRGIGFGAIFGAITALSAAGLVTFGITYLQTGEHGAQELGAFAFAAAVIFAMLAVFTMQWYEA
ncbi:hypothetical protein [Haloarchaeobius sp. HME9146]|uniref:DUF7525 family protein n=1 Tax=unclassified Haloarchaeobius TaxID=2614452 RepID=UPI0021C1F3B4|nr:hypothetical protein [Haloarchaeobius sp. HME9146]MCT9096473.1 hypothetical protein [Haloarchaeobius sp. HME9146]